MPKAVATEREIQAIRPQVGRYERAVRGRRSTGPSLPLNPGRSARRSRHPRSARIRVEGKKSWLGQGRGGVRPSVASSSVGLGRRLRASRLQLRPE